LVYIHFASEKEAASITKYASAHTLSAELHTYMKYENGESIYLFIEEQNFFPMLEWITDSLFAYMKNELMIHWLEQIIIEKFYYQESEEIEAIVDIAISIIEGQTGLNSPECFWENEKEVVKNGLHPILQANTSFSFHSFSKFRLKGINDKLLEFVEMAIDEYKLEQDYQNFIHFLREFMHAQKPKANVLHVLHKESVEFYSETFEKLEKREIIKQIDRKLLAENPMYIDSNLIAPLISIAPERLFLYVDRTDHGVIQTVMRIFEERASIKTIAQFYSLQYEKLNDKDRVL
jgi:putative sporulation protein YtxC